VCRQFHVLTARILRTFLCHCRRSLSHARQDAPPHRNINAVTVSGGIGDVSTAVRQISHRHADRFLIAERSGGHLHIRPVTGLQESSLRGVRRGADQIPHGSQCFPVSGIQHLLHAAVLPDIRRSFAGCFVGVVVDLHRPHTGILKHRPNLCHTGICPVCDHLQNVIIQDAGSLQHLCLIGGGF